MHPYKRSERVSDLIKEEIADIILHRLKYKTIGFITITAAEVSDDLRYATIYLSVLDPEEEKRTLRKLRDSASAIRYELAKRLKIKYIPALRFKIDKSIEYGFKIDRILDDIKEGRIKKTIEDDEDLF